MPRRSKKEVPDQEYNALDLAAGWLSVATTSGKDKEAPALCHTVSVEFYPGGVWLAATDRYMLLYAWIPKDGRLPRTPSLTEKPTAKAVVIDDAGRAKNLLAFLLAQARAGEANDPAVIIRMSITTGPDEDTAAIEFDGMERRWLVLEHPEHERLRLPLYEGEFPDWRKLISRPPSRADMIYFAAEMLARVAKVGRILGKAVILRPTGKEKGVHIEYVDPRPNVRGIAMPLKMQVDPSMADPTIPGA